MEGDLEQGKRAEDEDIFRRTKQAGLMGTKGKKE